MAGYLSVCKIVYLLVCLFVCLFVFVFISVCCLVICLYAWLSICLLSGYLSVIMFVYLFVCLFVRLSVCFWKVLKTQFGGWCISPTSYLPSLVCLHLLNTNLFRTVNPHFLTIHIFYRWDFSFPSKQLTPVIFNLFEIYLKSSSHTPFSHNALRAHNLH